jgi:hypothetical protein
MAVKGVFASDSNIPGTRKGDFASSLLEIDPMGSAPLLALSSGMPTKPANDVITTWFEENHLAGRTTVNGSENDSALSVAVDDVSFIVAGTILLNEDTSELIYVSAVNGATLTIERGFGGTTPEALTDEDALQKIGTTFEEGSARPVAVANLGYPRFNFVQIFRNTWNVTGTTRAVDYYIQNPALKNRRDASLQHAEDIERSCIWGRKQQGVRNGQPYRVMDGLVAQIVTNVTPMGDTTDWDDVDLVLRAIFERNIKGKPNERIALCGNNPVSVLNKIARLDGVVNITPGETEFGLKIMRWVTPYGSISLMTHPLFVENPTWTKDMFILHPGAIVTRYLRQTTHDAYDSDGSRAGDDADFGVFTTEMGIEYHAELTGGYTSGWTAGVATE